MQTENYMEVAPGYLVPTMPFREARRKLKVSAPVFNALVKSRMLGEITTQNEVLSSGLDHYLRYGTQWQTEERPELPTRMLSAEAIQNMPPPPDVGNEKYVGVQTRFYVMHEEIEDVRVTEETDTGWLAHFYLTPNLYFWPAPTSMGMVGSTLLRLVRRRSVPGTGLPTYLYPDPSDSLGLVTVYGANMPVRDAFETAYDVAAPVLDELSVEYDQPLPISHSLVLGIPSGLIITQFPTIPEAKTLAPGDPIVARCPYPELKHAGALYREGVSSNNPFHQFLTLWKVYENACEIRGNWRKRHRRAVVKARDEVFPKAFAFGGYQGLTFEQVRQKLNRPYRVALAHGGVIKDREPKTAATAEDLMSVSYSVPIVRYMAEVTLKNVRATLATSNSPSAPT